LKLLSEIVGKRVEGSVFEWPLLVFELRVFAILEAAAATLMRTRVEYMGRVELLPDRSLRFVKLRHIDGWLSIVPRDQVQRLG
jgi:hypothetical protein